MQLKLGDSVHHSPETAVAQATADISDASLILFFCPSAEFSEISRLLYQKYPNAVVIGSSSYMNFLPTNFNNTLTVAAITDGILAAGGVIRDIRRFPMKYADEVKASLASLGDTQNTVCFEIISAFQMSEELVQSTFTNILSEQDVPFFGGTAGSADSTEPSFISYNGEVFDSACVYVFIKNLGGRISIYKENIFKPTGLTFTASEADVENRIVYEYNDIPATQALQKALHTTAEELPSLLVKHPMGRIAGNQIFITDYQRIVEGGGIAYYARIYNHTSLMLLEPDDYAYVFRSTLSKIREDFTKPSFAIIVHCISRTKLYEQEAFLPAFVSGLTEVLPSFIGFSGFGEQFNGQHFNQTMLIAVFE